MKKVSWEIWRKYAVGPPEPWDYFEHKDEALTMLKELHLYEVAAFLVKVERTRYREDSRK